MEYKLVEVAAVVVVEVGVYYFFGRAGGGWMGVLDELRLFSTQVEVEVED